MKQISLFFLFLIPFFFACNSKKQQESLRIKQERLQQKEQELLVKEKTLEIREAALLKREEALKHPPVADTMAAENQAFIGNWTVKMICRETTCPGSAIGDTKTEQWQISYQDNRFIAKAMTNDKLVRVYSGLFTGNTLELIAEKPEVVTQPAANIIARISKAEKNTLTGQREITREDGCKIIYELQMTRE